MIEYTQQNFWRWRQELQIRTVTMSLNKNLEIFMMLIWINKSVLVEQRVSIIIQTDIAVILYFSLRKNVKNFWNDFWKHYIKIFVFLILQIKARFISDWLLKLFLILNLEKLDKLSFQRIIPWLFNGTWSNLFWIVMFWNKGLVYTARLCVWGILNHSASFQ